MPRLYGGLGSLGADEPAAEPDALVLRRVDASVAKLLAAQKAEESRRKLTLIFTAAGVLFAAVKLGFIAVPHVIAWKRER